jgi:hypothetical protein
VDNSIQPEGVPMWVWELAVWLLSGVLTLIGGLIAMGMRITWNSKMSREEFNKAHDELIAKIEVLTERLDNLRRDMDRTSYRF